MAHRAEAISLAREKLAQEAKSGASELEQERIGKRRANLAVALLRLGNAESVWPVLKFSTDPTARSYLIHWAGPLGDDSQAVVKQLDAEPDVTIRRGLVLMLGEFTDKQLPVDQRRPVIKRLLATFENDPDAGLHGTAEWLLRKWDQSTRLQKIVDKFRSSEKQLQARKPTEKRRWYVNTQGQTYVILKADAFPMGSPESERGRSDTEKRHPCHIGRRFAVSTADVTKAQYRVFSTSRKEFRSSEL